MEKAYYGQKAIKHFTRKRNEKQPENESGSKKHAKLRSLDAANAGGVGGELFHELARYAKAFGGAEQGGPQRSLGS